MRHPLHVVEAVRRDPQVERHAARLADERPQGGTVGDALAKTFDGKHPCALCNAIAAGKKSEKRSEFPVAGKKFEFSYSATVFVFSAPTHFWEASGLAARADSLSHAPPVPPPKLALG